MKQKLWCCVGFGFKEPYYHLTSLSKKRKDSILKFEGGVFHWENYKSKGWKCIKVEVIIKPINNLK